MICVDEMGPIFRELSYEHGIQVFLITLGAQGMVLWRRSWGDPVVIPAVRQEVFDVSGAGDTALAVFVAAQEMGLLGAARLANRAASIAVSRPGTVAVRLEDLDGCEN